MPHGLQDACMLVVAYVPMYLNILIGFPLLLHLVMRYELLFNTMGEGRGKAQICRICAGTVNLGDVAVMEMGMAAKTLAGHNLPTITLSQAWK